MTYSKNIEHLVDEVLNSLETVTAWKHDPSSIERRRMSKLHELMYGEALSAKPKCGCVEDFANVLHRYQRSRLLSKLEHMDKKQFVLKQGRILQNYVLAEPLSNASSDADCIKLLRATPGAIKHFEKFPDNWEELISEGPSQDSTEGTEGTEGTDYDPDFLNLNTASLTDLQARASDLGIDFKSRATRAELRELIIAKTNDI